MHYCLASLAALLCAFLPGRLIAHELDPLRLVPRTADVVVKVESPPALYDAIYGHDVFQKALKVDALAGFYDTDYFRRVLQVIAYLEKELGHDRLDLLERLTGGGAIVAGLFEQKAILIVVQAKDEELPKKFVTLARKIINQELARQGAVEKVQARPYRDVETLHVGSEFHAARAGPSLLFSNQSAVLEKAIDLFLDGAANSIAQTNSVAELKGLLPQNPLLWGLLNLEQIKSLPNVKNTLNTLGLDPTTMFVVGGLVDVIKRSPYACASLARDGDNLEARIAMPRGRDGMAPLAAMFLPEDDHASLPMLKPPRVLSSTSYFLDLGRFWDNRHKILTPEQAKSMDQFEAQTGKYLRGLSLGAILRQAGKYHRIVSTIPETFPYKIKPTVQTGAFGVVLDMRDPAFAKSMSTILRGVALVAGFQYGLKMVDEKHQGHTLVTYYFPENGKFAGDDNNIRFNFNPCFTQVGSQFIIASTLELGKDLIDCLIKETDKGYSPATQRTHVYGSGVAANLRAAEDLLVSQTILSQALPAADAKKQFEDLIRLIERLGQVNFETRYEPRAFRVDIRWQYDKK